MKRATGRFDRFAQPLLSFISSSWSAAAYKLALSWYRDDLIVWVEKSARLALSLALLHDERELAKLTGNLTFQLWERSAHWCAEAFRVEREAEQLTRAPEQERAAAGATTEREATSIDAPADFTGDRQVLVENFLRRCNLEPDLSRPIIKKDIWRAAGHAKARQFQHWQANSQRTNRTDEETFQRILGMAPPAFIELLRKNHLLRASD